MNKSGKQIFKHLTRKWYAEEEELDEQANEWITHAGMVVDSFEFTSTRDNGEDEQGTFDLILLCHPAERG